MSSEQPEIPVLPPGVFNNSLGLLYVGFIVSSILYGTSMLQTFIYMTSQRTALDHVFTKFFVFILFLSDTLIQFLLTWAMYRLLITDFGNPNALGTRGPTSGPHLLNYSGIPSTVVGFIVQIFFVHRIWGFSLSLRSPLKWIFTVLTICLSLLNFSTSLAVIINSLINSAAPRPNAQLWRLSLSSSVVTDMALSVCLVIILVKERTGKPGGVNTTLNYLILMTISTGLATTAVTLASLITYFASTQTTWYLALDFVSNKLYVNSALAALNSREMLRRVLVRPVDTVTMPDFRTNATNSEGLSGLSGLSMSQSKDELEARQESKSIKSTTKEDKAEANSPTEVSHHTHSRLSVWSRGQGPSAGVAV